MTREQLEQGRHRYDPHRIYGYFYSYCNQMGSCEVCKEKDKKIWRLCVKKRKLEDRQTKRILKICKSEQDEDE